MKTKEHACKVCGKPYKKRQSTDVTCRPTCQGIWIKQRREERAQKLSIRITGCDKEENRKEIREKLEEFMPTVLSTRQITIKVSRMKLKTEQSKLHDKADILWSRAVKQTAGGKCEYCGGDEFLNSHHIIGRANMSTRWYLKNGICLCANHHKFSSEFSAHGTPAKFQKWYIEYIGEYEFMELNSIGNQQQKVTEEFLQQRIDEFSALLKGK